MTRPAVYLNLQYSEAHYDGVLLYIDSIQIRLLYEVSETVYFFLNIW
jgi:hypothetical protein